MSIVRHYALVLPVLAGLAAGCAQTHPRPVSDLDRVLSKPRRVLVLEPRAQSRVRLISTEEFVPEFGESLRFSETLTSVLCGELRARGHLPITERGLRDRSPASRSYLDGLAEKLLGLAQMVAALDPDYVRKSPDHVDVGDAIPVELAYASAHRPDIDLVVAIDARYDRETERQFWWRWAGNVGLNLLSLPISVASALIPVAMPISVNVSTSFFVPCPDRTFVNMIVVDVEDRRIVYQNDYFDRSAPEDADDYTELVELLFDRFGEEIPNARQHRTAAQREAPRVILATSSPAE